MLLQILIVVVLSPGAVVSIYDPHNVEKTTKSYRRDPHIARALEQYHHRHASYVRDPLESRATQYHARLSPDSVSYQQRENVERHANYGRPRQDYANNIDDNYSGCPSGFTGLLPYPYDCRRFVNCWKGRAYIQNCGPGTVFNGETMECDNPTKVVCKGLGGSGGNPSQEPPQNHRLGRVQQEDVVSCPPGYSGLLPHPHDCSKFLNCGSGTMHVQSCGPQTMYSPHIKACDFAHKVNCSGRNGGSPASGNRDGKTFEIISRENAIINQEQPQRKGWPHFHHHHHYHQISRHPSSASTKGSFNNRNHNHNHNCTHVHPQPAPTPVSQTPIFHRDRWASMNRTRPSAPGDKPSTWQTTVTVNTGQWTPTPTTTKKPQRTWTPATPGNSPKPSTTPTTTTVIYYAQPVEDDQPSEELFTNIVGADVSEVTLPRRNASRGDYFPSVTRSNPLPQASGSSLNIPNTNLMPPHPPSSPDDDRQFQLPEQFPDDSSPLPSQPQLNPRTVSLSRTENHWQSTDENHPSMDAINIPNTNLMPPHLPSSNDDDRQFQIPEQFPPEPQKPPPKNSKPVYPLRTEDHWQSVDNNHPSMDAINIPSMNLMPPHPSAPTDDDRQFQIPEQFPDYSSPYPPYVAPPQPQKPPSKNPKPVSPPRTDNHWPSTDKNHPSMDAINIPSMNLMPPHRETPNWPSFSAPAASPQPPEKPLHPNWPSFSATSPPVYEQYPPYPSSTPKPSRHPQNPNWPSFSTPSGGQTQPPAPNQPPSWTSLDESNLFGGLLPPHPSQPEEPPGESFFTPLPTPSTPTPPLHHSYFTTPPPQVIIKTKIYPPPSVQNATTRLHPHPIYSPSYSGVAHSRNITWSSSPPIKTAPPRTTPKPRSLTPEDNFEPEIIFSQDGGVVVVSNTPTTTTEHHGVSPPSYNRQFYRQTAPSSVQQTPSSNDDVGQMPINEAIRLLLRPYFNRSGTVTDDMAAKAESHIMNLSRSQEPSTTTTDTTSTTTTSTVAPEPQQEVEIVFAGEQNYMTPSQVYPHQSPASSPSKYHHNQHHDRNFHRTHPRLPNPFANEPPGAEEDDTQHELTTPKVFDEEGTTITPEVVESPSVDDVCQFDCGNNKCIKAFEICDGINNCGNRKDEEQCDHLGYEIRLSGEGSGRVEVKILGHWGYVCDDKFGIQDANVVCRELGFPLGASEVHGNSFYPPADGEEVSFVMDEVDCIGNETSLKSCSFMGWGVSDCGPDEVVGVQCKTPVMTCPNDYWLCSTSKECIPPAFVCDNVPDCSDKSDESEAICNSTVQFRLRGGRTSQEGRLEVMYRGVWGTICDDDFGQSEAQVACNSLGHYGTAKIVKNAFGPGSGPIWLDQVSCYGNETTIDACHHWSWGEHNCNHTEDVSLKCTAGVRPGSINTAAGVKGALKPKEDVQTTTLDDLGMDFFPMERSSKFANTHKVCGHFNANLTEELPLELERVVKGNVAKRGHHPWQATIRTKGRGGISSHWCGAVLISKKHILTAAHCLAGYPKGAYFIRLGDHYANIAESSEIDSYIENWYIHEKFREGTHMNNDIALIVMKNPVRFNDYIQPICLPPEGIDYQEGRRCTISGWGSIQSGVSTPSNNLRVAEIPVISGEVCKLPHVYGNSITEGMFCAGYLEEGVDACEGDSGGPFVCSDEGSETLYGIISWGQQCGHANKPGVYVRIEKYLDWIYEKIRFSMQQT